MIYDISVPIDACTPRWPGTRPLSVRWISRADGKGKSNETWLSMSSHAGTHLDAPLHFLNGAGSVKRVPLEACMGPTLVVHLPKAKEIGEKELRAARIPRGAKRLLFKTSNGKLWKKSAFDKNFVGLTADGAAYLAKRGMLLVGVDYLSVAAYKHVLAVHETLLKKRTVLLEGINLSNIAPGRYELACLPLNIPHAEAAPVRAVLTR